MFFAKCRTAAVLLSSFILLGCASHDAVSVAATPTATYAARNMTTDAIDTWLKQADKGNAQAQFELAWAYDIGQTVVEDKQQAAFWYYKAASQGHANAQFNLGVLYATGLIDATRNYTAAVELFQNAAEQNYPAAQYQLATMYQDGLGVERSDKMARQWYERAAGLGNMKAMIELGDMTAGSEPETSFAWYQQAAELGSQDAQFFIAGVYRQQGTCDKAESWLRRAALQGHRQARQQLDALVCNAKLG